MFNSSKKKARKKAAESVLEAVTSAWPTKKKPSKKGKFVKIGVGAAVATAIAGVFVKPKNDQS